MVLGKIIGKSNTVGFKFLIEANPKKFDYVKVIHKEHGPVLCQIIEIETDSNSSLASCIIFGYKANDGIVKPIRTPFDYEEKVLEAEDDFIKDVIQIKHQNGAYIGKLEGKDIDIYLDLNILLTKHLSVIAKSGAGKSYTVGVILEEIMERKIPLLIIDPHGEYSTLKYPNDDEDERLKEFGITKKNFARQIQEFGDTSINYHVAPLKLNENMTVDELLQILPAKINSNQQVVLYSALKDYSLIDFEKLIYELEIQDSSAKWTVINIINHLKRLNLFSKNYTNYNELIQPGKCSIINLKGMDPEIQEIVVYKLLKDLFMERKKEKVPPFFAIIEEAHNFCPERSFGEAKSSKVIRTIASEGRKFGLGLGVVTQRPARIDKSVLSQCSTQIILKITNPNDLKAITSSLENITAESETEIQNLPIGVALVCGVVDIPLFVKVRPRKTKHGGSAVDMFEDVPDENIIEKVDEFAANNDLICLIRSKVSKRDLELMSERTIKEIKTYLIPAVIVSCRSKNERYELLIEMIKGRIVIDIQSSNSINIPIFSDITPLQMQVLNLSNELKGVTNADIMMKLNQDFGTSIDLIQRLCKLGYLEVTPNKKYILSKNIAFDLDLFKTNERPEYMNVTYDKKLEPKINIDEIKERITKLVDVTDIKNCFIEWHSVEYETVLKNQEETDEKEKRNIEIMGTFKKAQEDEIRTKNDIGVKNVMG